MVEGEACTQDGGKHHLVGGFAAYSRSERCLHLSVLVIETF